MARRAGREARCKQCGGTIYFLDFAAGIRKPLEAAPTFVIPDPAASVGGYTTDGDWIQGREVPEGEATALVRQLHTRAKCDEVKRRRRFEAARGRG